MAKTAILAVKIISDAQGVAATFDQVGGSADKMGARLGKAAKVAGVALAGLGVAAVSAAKAAASDQKSQALLAKTMQNNAGSTARQVAATEKWIDAQARATGVADDQLRPALGNIVRATGDVALSQKALQTAMDISAATGKPLESVSAAIAKGYGGQTTALGRLVPGLDKATLKSGDMSKIMGELAQKTGGAAATAAGTAEGKYKKLQVAFGEIQESLGAVLLPVLEKFAGVLGTVAGFAEKHQTAFLVLVGTFAALAGAVVVVNAAYKGYQAAIIAAGVAQKVFNVALKANPIGLVITAIGLLVAGFVLAYKKSETFRDIVNAVGTVGKKALGFIVDAAKDVWGWIQKVVDKIASLVEWIKKIKWPSVPKAIAGLFGNGGPPAAAAGYGGAPRPAYSSLPGRGGPGSPGFMTRVSGFGGNGTYVNITIEGALDPNSVARQIEQLLTRRGVKLGAAW